MKNNTLCAVWALACSGWAAAQNATPQDILNSRHLKQIAAPAAWKYSTGAGVTIGIIDSGVNLNNPDLKGQIITAPKTNFSSANSLDILDALGHGTQVAGIAAALANGSGVAGVAPGAKILPLRVADSNGVVMHSALASAINRAADLVPIANISVAGPVCCANEIRAAVGKGLLITVAAGNEGKNDPAWPARYASEGWAMGRIIAVGAVDASNKITSWSNRAGSTKDFFLVAPGNMINSTKGSGTGILIGTSAAAPQVAATAALVKSRWQYLRAEQIVQVLLQSATDLGAKGTDPVYGRGLLNAERAMRPIGQLALPLKSGAVIPVSVVPSTAYASALKSANLQMTRLDTLGRDFSGAFSDVVTVSRESAMTKALGSDKDDEIPLHSRVKLDARRTFSIGLSGGVSSLLSLPSGKPDALHADNPLLGLMPSHAHLGYLHEVSDSLKLKFVALVSSKMATTEGAVSPPDARARAAVASLVYGDQARAIGLTVASLQEQKSFLGGYAIGVPMESPTTVLVTLETSHELGDDLAGYLQLTVARGGVGNSIENGFSVQDMQARSFKFGVVADRMEDARDQMRLSVAQPLRVARGQLLAALPVAVDESGAPQFAQHSLDLAPAGRELQFVLEYARQFDQTLKATGFVQINTQPGHDEAAASERMIGLRWVKKF